MTDTKWTPGPWSVEQPMDFELTIVEAGKPTYEWRFIATCGLPDEKGDIPKKQVIANVNLIAAAPELYHALEGLVAWADDLRRMDPAEDLRKARAALAKARGE